MTMPEGALEAGTVIAVCRNSGRTFAKPSQRAIRLRTSGVMSVVIAAGDVRPGDAIAVEFPPLRLPHCPLEVV